MMLYLWDDDQIQIRTIRIKKSNLTRDWKVSSIIGQYVP